MKRQPPDTIYPVGKPFQIVSEWIRKEKLLNTSAVFFFLHEAQHDVVEPTVIVDRAGGCGAIGLFQTRE